MFGYVAKAITHRYLVRREKKNMLLLYVAIYRLRGVRKRLMRPLELERVKNNAIRPAGQESSPKENETIGCTAAVSRKIDSMYHNFANWPSVSMSDEHASGRGRTAAQFSNRRQYITRPATAVPSLLLLLSISPPLVMRAVPLGTPVATCNLEHTARLIQSKLGDDGLPVLLAAM